MEIDSALDRFSALSHPDRLALFRLLMRRYPDALSAGEIAEVLGLKPSTTSAHLATLVTCGMIARDRQGTSRLYRARLDSPAELVSFLTQDCCRGRPDLCPPSTLSDLTPAMTDRPLNALFICTGNSARSIFAEALLRELGGDRFAVHSAGTKPFSELNPMAVEMLRIKGHDTRPLRSKHMSEFQAEGAPVMDFVFTVCDLAANEDCPAWPGQPISAHWGTPDPVKAEGTEAERHLAFQQAYGMLRNRITAFAALPFDTLDRLSLQAAVDDIAAAPQEETPE